MKSLALNVEAMIEVYLHDYKIFEKHKDATKVQGIVLDKSYDLVHEKKCLTSKNEPHLHLYFVDGGFIFVLSRSLSLYPHFTYHKEVIPRAHDT